LSDVSWFNLYKRQHVIRSEQEFNELENIFRRQGYKFDKKIPGFFKYAIPDLEIKKLEKLKKTVVYDDETGKILTDSEINEMDELRNCSLYPNTIIVQENPKQPQIYETVNIIKKKRGKKLRLPLSDSRRKEVLQTYNYSCSICGYISKSNQIHHLDEDPSNNELENLVVYCYECHKKIHSKEV
jgi:predicted restriction endonuclease